MKIKSNVRFIEGEDSCTCIATPAPCSAIERIEKLRRIVAFYYDIPCLDEDFLVPLSKSKRIPMPFTQKCVGVARYKSGDVKDIEMAKRIARKKAVRRLMKEYRNTLKILKQQIEYINRETQTSVDMLSRKIDKITNEISM